MAVVTARTYATDTLPGATAATNFLRAAVDQDTADNQDLPIEVFNSTEATGVATVDEGA
jgi:hypothetical protein